MLRIIKLLLNLLFSVNFSVFKKKIGIIIENKQNINLKKYGSSIILSTKDKMIKCKGVCTNVNSTGSVKRFYCNANIKP